MAAGYSTTLFGLPAAPRRGYAQHHWAPISDTEAAGQEGHAMVDVGPFSALRYRDLSRLDVLTAPRYDTINPVLSRRLRTRSPYNVVRLELDATRPPWHGGSGRYSAAARTYARWRSEGILELDSESALYVYEQTYDHGGVGGRQRGLLVALRLEPWQSGDVLPHEHVFPGPVEDRLRLLEALPVNTSPVYLLAEREPDPVAELLAEITRRSPLAAFIDAEEGVHHRFWRVTDRDAHAAVRWGFAPQRLLMADGHHRYTTALEYRARHPPAPEGEGSDRILAFIVSGDGPLVRPSHRLLRRLPNGFEARLRAAGFERTPVSATTATPVGDVMAALADPPPAESPDEVGVRQPGPLSARSPVFGLLSREGGAVVVVQDEELVAELLATVPQPLHDIDVVLLQRVLDVSLGSDEPSAQVAFASDAAAAAEEVAAGRAAGAFLVRPVPVSKIWAAARAGLLLPPKSTSFFPKPRTGLVLRPLSE